MRVARVVFEVATHRRRGSGRSCERDGESHCQSLFANTIYKGLGEWTQSSHGVVLGVVAELLGDGCEQRTHAKSDVVGRARDKRLGRSSVVGRAAVPGSPKKKARLESTSSREGANVLGAGSWADIWASAVLPARAMVCEGVCVCVCCEEGTDRSPVYSVDAKCTIFQTRVVSGGDAKIVVGTQLDFDPLDEVFVRRSSHGCHKVRYHMGSR